MCSDASGPPADIVISASGVTKTYRRHDRPSRRLWQALVQRSGSDVDGFTALHALDLEIRRGETVGIIGRNGSGKSTLLQIIAGTLNPTRGDVRVNGKVAALLELGSGFDPEFTGRENVYLNAAILGLSREQVDARLEEILAFAEIGDFIDQPVRNYSSGMAVRLAFSVVAHVDADVLIIDEALSVGDAFFAQKCMRFLRRFQQSGTLLFVSHDAAAVVNLCRRAIWLDGGRMRMEGAAQDVMEAYMAEQHAASRQGAEVKIERKRRERSLDGDIDVRAALMREAGLRNRFASFEFDPDQVGTEFGAQAARIESVFLESETGGRISVFEGGEVVRLVLTARLHEPLEQLIVGFYVKDRLGQRLFGDNTFLAYRDSPLSGNAGDGLRVVFTFRMPFMPSGSYMIDAAVASGDQDEHTQQHWIHDALEFRALDETMRHGLVGLPMLAIDAEIEPT